MTTDSLNRRLRFAPPEPHVKRLVLTEADYLLFESIDRHGPLPSHYLYELTKDVRRASMHLKNRLTEMYNGDEGGPYLERPTAQFDSFQARYQPVIYDLAPRARLALAERGALMQYCPKRTDAMLHRFMSGCVGVSLELASTRAGIRYIHAEEIFAHPKCPESTRASKSPLAIPVDGIRTITPDALFGLEYPGAGFKFFALEIDRNTESIERRHIDQSSFGRKLEGYREILDEQIYARHLGLPNLHVLTVTTNATHGRNILDSVRKMGSRRLESRFAIAVDSSFGSHWRVPKTVMTHLFAEPWITTAGTKDLSTP